jgi:hypothetical protein
MTRRKKRERRRRRRRRRDNSPSSYLVSIHSYPSADPDILQA